MILKLPPKIGDEGKHWGNKTRLLSTMGAVEEIMNVTEEYISLTIEKDGKDITPKEKLEGFYNVIIDTLFRKNNFDTTEKLLDQLFDHFNEEPDIISKLEYQKAQLFFEKERFEEALEYLEKISSTHPNKRHLNLNLSLCYKKLGDLEKAKNALVMPLEEDNWWKYYGRISEIQSMEKENEVALKNLYRALEKEDEGTKDNTTELVGFTLQFVYEEKFNEVVEFLISAHDKYPKNPYIFDRLVDALGIFYQVLKPELRDQAEKYANDLLIMAENDENDEDYKNHLKSQGNQTLGIIKIENGDRKEGWELLKKGLEIDLTNISIVDNIIDYSKNKKEYLDALEALEEYQSQLKIGLDMDERLLRVQEKFISKLKNDCLKTKAINIRLFYENRLFENRMNFFESKEMYTRVMKGHIDEILLIMKEGVGLLG